MTTKSTSKPKKSFDTGVIIAIIGLIATIGAALISAVFSYMSTKTQIELPIGATQTAELKIPSPISTNTPFPVPSPTLAPTQTSLNINTNLNWQDYLEVETGYLQCNRIILLPQELDYSGSDGPDKISEAISQGLGNGNILLWAKVPEVDSNNSMYVLNQATVTFDINNIASQDWVEIDKSVTVSVNTEKEIPQKINVVRVGGGCGGGSDIRDFPPLTLETTFRQYTDKTTYTEFDYFKLEEGEFEKFQFPFTCQSPGYYRLTLDIPFQIRNKTGNMQATADVVCPSEVTVWFYDMMMNKLEGIRGNYFWDGNNYTSK